MPPETTSTLGLEFGTSLATLCPTTCLAPGCGGGAATPADAAAAAFCAQFAEHCGPWSEQQLPCETFFAGEPAGVPGAMTGASQACLTSHLDMVATMGNEHCQHAEGLDGSPCTDATGAPPSVSS